MATRGSSKTLAVLVYTALRVTLFAGVWLTIELLTPINGLLAIIAAILVSGAISLLVLDRQRGRAASVAAGFFGRINERIEASARAEDVDDEPVAQPKTAGEAGEGEKTVGEAGEGEKTAGEAGEGEKTAGASGEGEKTAGASGEGEQGAERDAVDKQ